ncbi:DUF1758 domain-containing protein [Trichonephila clavata]|uniref:DUF1758 domain-containing protein n=1 Tax=Trichonephila clavata TaxID=2740835 RepID=A0A8X6LLU3_TRICU|nr:DUF1758 domain-containing protein [Trichonephila clavata]
MCPEKANNARPNTADDTSIEGNVVLANQSEPEIILQTLLVLIEVDGRSKMVRALFDTGGQRSYVLKSTINEMSITTERCENLKHVVFGGASSKKKHNCYKLSVSNLRKHYYFKIQVLDQEIICGHVPIIQRSPRIKELQNKGNICHLSSGLIAVDPYLGWSVMGRPKAASNNYSCISLFVQSHDISNLWRLEIIGIMDPCETDSSKDLESKVIDYFSSSVKIDEDGRYEIKLPWMRSLDELPINRDIAGKRLVSTSIKLLKGNKFECYNDAFEEWENEDFIEGSVEGSGHYLTHRGDVKYFLFISSSEAGSWVISLKCICRVKKKTEKQSKWLEKIDSSSIYFSEKV